MDRIAAAQEQYESFFPHERVANIERQQFIKDRTLYHLVKPDVKDLDVLVGEEGHLLEFIEGYWKAPTAGSQKAVINTLIAAIEKIALRIAKDEADD